MKNNTIIIKLTLCIFCSFVFLCASGQIKKLSDSDNAKIQKYIESSSQNEQAGDKKEASRFLDKIAEIYWENHDYQPALNYYQKSIKLNTDVGNESGIAMIKNNIGMIYADMKQYENAVDYFKATLEYRRKEKEKISIISGLINISVVLNNLKRYNESAVDLEEALDLAREMNDAQQMRLCYGMLSETYEKAGNNEKTIYYFNLYRTFHELVEKESRNEQRKIVEETKLREQVVELENRNKQLEIITKEKELEEKDKTIGEIDSSFQKLIKKYSKKELTIELLNREAKIKQLTLNQSQENLKQQTLVRNFFIVICILGALFSLFLYRNFRLISQKNRLLNKQNTEISEQRIKILKQKSELESTLIELKYKKDEIDSGINYALNIQKALLPHQESFQRLFDESFIFFKPRDILSGDFYWFRRFKNKIYVAAVDCTGHGIPGAFMSILASDLLNHIIVDDTLRTDQILNELHCEVVAALHQENNKNQEGMEMTIYAIDKEEKTLEFSGARNPLVYIQDNQMNVIRGDKFGIGGIYSQKFLPRCFTPTIISLDKPTWLYVFSDGFEDQFGGPNDRKFMLARLKEMLLENHQKPFSEQQQELDKALANWCNGNRQIDDILVIGTKINLT